MKARLAIIAAVGGLALAGAPEALADPIPLAPADGAEFTARVDQIAFQASTAVIPAPGRMIFYVSRDTGVSDGELSNPFDDFLAGPDAGAPPVYAGGAGPRHELAQQAGHLLLAGRLQQLRLRRPELLQRGSIADHRSSAAPQPRPHLPTTRPFPMAARGRSRSRTSPLTRAAGTRIDIEFSKSTDLRPDGTFADPYCLPGPAGRRGRLRVPAGRPVTPYAGDLLLDRRALRLLRREPRLLRDATARSDPSPSRLRVRGRAPNTASPAIRRVERASAGPGSRSPPDLPDSPSSASTPGAGRRADRRRGSGASSRAATGSRFGRSPTARGIQPRPRGCSRSFADAKAAGTRDADGPMVDLRSSMQRKSTIAAG